MKSQPIKTYVDFRPFGEAYHVLVLWSWIQEHNFHDYIQVGVLSQFHLQQEFLWTFYKQLEESLMMLEKQVLSKGLPSMGWAKQILDWLSKIDFQTSISK